MHKVNVVCLVSFVYVQLQRLVDFDLLSIVIQWFVPHPCWLRSLVSASDVFLIRFM